MTKTYNQVMAFSTSKGTKSRPLAVQLMEMSWHSHSHAFLEHLNAATDITHCTRVWNVLGYVERRASKYLQPIKRCPASTFEYIYTSLTSKCLLRYSSSHPKLLIGIRNPKETQSLNLTTEHFCPRKGLINNMIGGSQNFPK